jgi:alpha-ketoglutarate-dependent taurine dioxygenase
MPVAAPQNITYEDLEEGAFENALARDGYAHASGFPDEFDYERFLRRLGRFVPQYDGRLVWSIKAEARYDDVYHSLNTKELMPHTECYEFEGDPPRYLALWCLVPSQDGQGRTTLADGYEFVETLSDAERRHLARREFEFVSTPGLKSMELGTVARHPLIEERSDGGPILRFSYHCINHEEDPVLLSVRERLLEFFERMHVAVDYERGDLLVWDNHRVLHSRTKFTDRRRHLRRVWIA